MYQDERKLDFKPLGIAIKKAREAKGWTFFHAMKMATTIAANKLMYC